MILIVFYVSYHSQTHPLGILLELIEDGVVAELEDEVQLSLSTKHLHRVDHDDDGGGDDDGDYGDGDGGYADNNDDEHGGDGEGGAYMMMMVNRMTTKVSLLVSITITIMTIMAGTMMMMNTSIRLTRFGCFRFLSILQMDILTQGTQLTVHTYIHERK